VKHHDAVIIGGGVIGASIAYHFSVCGFKNIAVIDKAPASGLGEGSTARATGGFRAQFGSQINILLSLLSRKKLFEFKNETGIDPCFDQNGYLFLAQNEDELSRLKQANALQHKCGLTEAGIITPEEIYKLNPHINLSGITGGAFCQSDGFIKPLEILKGYTQAAIRNGVKFFYNTEVTGFEMNAGEIISAKTSQGDLNSGIFINAAGAWTANIAAFAGINIPVTPIKRQVAKISNKDLLPANLPMTIWVDNSFHFRIRDKHVILLMPAPPEDSNPFSTEPEPGWQNKVFEVAKNKIPVLCNAAIDHNNSWAGLYEMSPDEHVMLGKAPGFNNFYMACGSSGHGVMHSPALGELLAQMITGTKTTLDVSSLDPARFDNGEVIKQIHFF
jgi:sarcosine oxidase, subunit beta